LNRDQSGPKNPFYGRTHTEETKKRVSEIKKKQNLKPWLGKKLSAEHRKKISLAKKGRTRTWNRGLKNIYSKETIRKMRRSANQNNFHPNYNENACKFFHLFDRFFGFKGKYAPDEQKIGELGYFVDYFNPTERLIIEWDERKHYDADGNLKEKDYFRQKEIENHFPGFYFLRFKEEDFLDVIDNYDETMEVLSWLVHGTL